MGEERTEPNTSVSPDDQALVPMGDKLEDSPANKDSDDSATDDEDSEPVDIGMTCQIKNLYEGRSRCDCCYNWVEEYPEDLKESLDKKLTQKYAVVVKKKKSHNKPKPLELHEIGIQSPLLKDFLQQTLLEYQNIPFALEEVVFSPPFAAFFHYLPQIKAAAANHESAEIKSHVRVLYNLLKKEFSDTVKAHEELVQNHIINFGSLWAIYQPGDLIIESDEGMYKLIKTSYETTNAGRKFQLQCRYVDWNGEKFGYGKIYKSISEFDNTVQITELPLYPLRFAKDIDPIRESFLCRGRKFESLSGCYYKAYRGLATEYLSFYSFSRGQATHVEGRVIVDATAYFQYNPDEMVSLVNLPSIKPQSTTQETEKSGNSDKMDTTIISKAINSEGSGTLTEEQLLISVPYVRGYSLQRKRWVQLHVDNILDIIWDDDAFKNLILPSKCKELLHSLVESKITGNDGFDDFITGKGQSVVILLSGDTGVGKTLTAESVAENMKTPLYSVTAGELGSDIESLEATLMKVLELAARWNAVLLLDEADVFLEQRSNHEVERNKLVSIFLRTLEYYKGILFVTTNRMSSIDVAFMSRIHLSLKYPTLSRASQKEIWKSFINRSSLKSVEFDGYDMASFTKTSMNGREIKNAVKLAHLLASKRKERLGPVHVEEVLSVVQGDLFKDFVGAEDRVHETQNIEN